MRKIIQPCGFHCIKINNLGVSFGEQTVLEDVNMHIHCGSFNVIIGQNGAGKSTLIKAILGEIPHTGTIEFRDTKDGHMAKLKIGYVPQSVNIEKNTPVSVYDVIASYQYMDYLKTHYDLAIILISHDLDYVARYADHVVLLDKTVAKQGTVKEVFESKEFERIFYTGEESWVREEEHK